MIDDFKFMRGAHVRLSLLRDRYEDLVHRGMYEAAVRVYMLYLIGCTILADKSHVYIDAKYTWMFNNLKHYSWA